MAPVVTLEDKIYKKAKKDAYDELYWELAKGVQNVKKGEVYTLQEAWEEIDKRQNVLAGNYSQYKSYKIE